MDVTLSLTHDCNLACTYCYAGNKHRTVMPWSVAEQALSFAFSFEGIDLQLGFFGGEPLLEWDLLVRCSTEANRLATKYAKRLKRTVTTNGTLLTPERVEWLYAEGFVPAISMDGNQAMHDLTRPARNGKSSFGLCRAGLHMALEVFPELEVIVVPDPVNVTHLAAGVRYLVEEQRVLRVSLNPNFYVEWSEDALAEWRHQCELIGDFFIESYRAGRAIAVNFIDGKIITHLKCGFEDCDRCNFGEAEIAIAPSGNIYPCERLVGNDDDDAMCIGTVFAGFDEKKRQAILARRGCRNDECNRCTIQPRCMNWCCCINYSITGAIDVTDGIVCFHERMAVDIADRVAGQLFNEGNPLFLARFYGEDFIPPD